MALKNYYSERLAGAEANHFSRDQYALEGVLKRILAHLPYPIRELPGFRSGKPLLLFLAFTWYALLISLGFFSVAKNPEYSAEQNRFYDIATFMLFIVPTLDLGNYLGVRDRLPWRKASRAGVEYIRIVIGAVASVFIVMLTVTIAALVLHI